MVWERFNGAPLEAEPTKATADIDHSGAGGMEHGHNGMPSSEREVEVEVAAEPTHGGGTAKWTWKQLAAGQLCRTGAG